MDAQRRLCPDICLPYRFNITKPQEYNNSQKSIGVRENFVESSVIGKNKNQTGIGFNINSSIYPKSGANSHLGGGALNPRPYIIAPSFVKIPHAEIAAMMLDLLDIATKAKSLAIIGCGMRPEDSFLRLLITRF